MKLIVRRMERYSTKCVVEVSGAFPASAILVSKALEKVRNGDTEEELEAEYVETLDEDTWIVETEDGEILF